MAGSDDKQLVEAALSGDTEAFSVLVDRYKNFVYRFFLRRIPDGECEDLTQEVFLVAWSHLDRFRRDGQFAGWLCTLAMKVAYRWMSGAYRRPQSASIPVMEAQSVLAHRDEHSAASKRETLQSIRTALSTLDDRSASLVHLVFDGGLSTTEAAATLGIPRATAFRVLREALNELRLRIEDREPAAPRGARPSPNS